MRINAYILAADPAWVEASVLSYYHLVNRIIVSYDEDGKGWTGVPIDIRQSLQRIRAIDTEKKMVYRAGHYARPEFFGDPLRNDTFQRQAALNDASDGADWVLQFDTDEVVAEPAILAESVRAASGAGADAVHMPFRWIYLRTPSGTFVEACRRFWRADAVFHGPIAVRAGTQLDYSRRIKGTHYHVDYHRRSLSPTTRGQLSDRIIRPSQAIYHLSWVREEEWLRRKFASWSHAHDRDWHPEVRRWLSARKAAARAVVTSQFERGPNKRHLRFVQPSTGVRNLLKRAAEYGDVPRISGDPSRATDALAPTI